MESDFYESIDFSVGDAVSEKIRQTNEQIAESVENHLTYDEVYGENLFG